MSEYTEGFFNGFALAMQITALVLTAVNAYQSYRFLKEKT